AQEEYEQRRPEPSSHRVDRPRRGRGFRPARWGAGGGNTGVMSAPAEERAGEGGLSGEELHEAWPVLSTQERLEGLSLLTHAETEALFLSMHAHDQAGLLVWGARPP